MDLLRTRKLDLATIIKWVAANCIGVAVGLPVGHITGKTLYYGGQRSLSGVSAILVFEVCVWTARGFVLQRFPLIRKWQKLDTAIWISGDLTGWFLAETILSQGKVDYIAATVLFGALVGSTVWQLMTLVELIRANPDWPGIANAVSIVLLVFSGIGMVGLGWIVAFEASGYLGWAGVGAVFGFMIGYMTVGSLIKQTIGGFPGRQG